jgi:hypothetical protein
MKLAQTVGADKYLTKPAPAARRLLKALREVMDKKAARLAPSRRAGETDVPKQYSQALVHARREELELAQANQT